MTVLKLRNLILSKISDRFTFNRHTNQKASKKENSRKRKRQQQTSKNEKPIVRVHKFVCNHCISGHSNCFLRKALC